MKNPSTRLCQIGALLLTMTCSLAGAADTACKDLFAGRKVMLVVPFGPGGGYDTYARVFAPVLEKHSGAKVVVSNMPGANTMLGTRAVTTAASDELVLGFLDPRYIFETALQKLPGVPSMSELTPLGTLTMSYSVVMGRRKVALRPNDPVPLLYANHGNISSSILVAAALGLNVKYVKGFKGSAEVFAALERGDIDVSSNQMESYEKGIGAFQNIGLLATLTSASVQKDVPYLAGPGGLADLFSRQLPAPVRQERLLLADLSAGMSAAAKGIYIAAGAPARTKACLTELVEKSIFDDAFVESAKRLKLDPAPISAKATHQVINELARLIDQNRALLDRVVQAGQ